MGFTRKHLYKKHSLFGLSRGKAYVYPCGFVGEEGRTVAAIQRVHVGPQSFLAPRSIGSIVVCQRLVHEPVNLQHQPKLGL